jgi:3-isopropylmalate/(R)-2-methylmalate dehydratase large subunit
VPLTLFERIWNDHLIEDLGDGVGLLQIDRHMVHEVSSPEAFVRLARAGRRVAAPAQTFATQDHILSTAPGRSDGTFPLATEYVRLLRSHCATHGIRLFDVHDARQGIVHVVAGEQGLALPGSTLVCGDSHTATVGALGALAWGIGSSEVEHVLATQTLAQVKPKPMQIRVRGRLAAGVTPKDLILGILRNFGITAGVGHAIEYAGEAIRALPIEGRMTVCNMSIELGARFGFVAPDDATLDYLHGKPYAPAGWDWDRAVASWSTLRSDDDADFAKVLELDASRLRPFISWGTTPGDIVAIDEPVPDLVGIPPDRREGARAAFAYMDVEPGMPLEGLPVDVVFIGSCTNSRLSDLRGVAQFVKGRHVAPNVRALVVPGSAQVKKAAEAEGIDGTLRAAGFEWREAGCSMCLGINDDVVPPGRRCVSTSNRNFEGRQGKGARTHLASPITAAACAIAGRIVDASRLE